MNSISYILVPFVLLVSSLVACERTVTLEDKIASSDVVVIGRVLAIDKGDIGIYKRMEKTQETFIAFEVVEALKGSVKRRIKILSYSVSYTVESKKVGNTYTGKFVSSSAGFSSRGIKPNQMYIAYLKKNEVGLFNFTRNSNQYLERINEEKQTVRDIGQGNRMVSLKDKLDVLRELCEAQ